MDLAALRQRLRECLDPQTNDYFRSFLGQPYGGRPAEAPLLEAAQPDAPPYDD